MVPLDKEQVVVVAIPSQSIVAVVAVGLKFVPVIDIVIATLSLLEFKLIMGVVAETT